MPELSFIEIMSNAFKTLINSKTMVLIGLEALVLLVYLIFNKKINSKMVKNTCLGASLIILMFYITNYISTIKIFIDNVSTKIIGIVYFPTTLEFTIIMGLAFGIMALTFIKSRNRILKLVNSIVPISLSFILLTIIEYINTYKIDFDEFSVFSNPALMSLYELAMGIFVIWICGLIIYKIDMLVIEKVTIKSDKIVEEPVIELPRLKEDIIELPRLKTDMMK